MAYLIYQVCLTWRPLHHVARIFRPPEGAQILFPSLFRLLKLRKKFLGLQRKSGLLVFLVQLHDDVLHFVTPFQYIAASLLKLSV